MDGEKNIPRQHNQKKARVAILYQKEQTSKYGKLKG